MATHSTRRPAAQWLDLVAQQRASGLSIAEFARRKDLVYQTFIRWCRKSDDQIQSSVDQSAAGPVQASPSALGPLPGFVELGIVGTDTVPAAPHDDAGGNWLVELELGGGLTLRVRRAA